MNIKKLITFLVASLLVIVILLIFTNHQDQSSQLEIVFLDIGQGDSILIKTPYNQQILIDGGPDNDVVYELGKNLPFYDRDLDLVILTHPHADHVAGLVEVLKRYDVKKVLHTGVLHTSPDYLAFLETIRDKKINHEIIKGQQDIHFAPDLKLEILYPFNDLGGQKVENLNNSSIVTRIVYQNFKAIFTGDAEQEEENELINSGFNLQADILKAGHHGSNTASSDAFLKAVNPESVIIQCGLDNDFGHPHLRALKRFKTNNIEVYRTDQQGQIGVVSNGKDYEILVADQLVFRY